MPQTLKGKDIKEILKFYKNELKLLYHCYIFILIPGKCPRKPQHTVHSDAFFLFSRDINRHCSWLDFLKIQVNLVNFLSCTFGRDWEKYSKNGLTFGCLAVFKFEIFSYKTFFSLRKPDFGNVVQIYVQI